MVPWWTELFDVWRDTRLIVLTAQIAAIYAAILIPFKAGIPIIPGFVELRPANAIPLVTSLLFGPPAAWGAGIGNIIGDCFGTLGPASIFGFLGNFFLAYLPYRLWGNLGWFSSHEPPVLRTWRGWTEYGIICLISSAVCAGIIGWGVEWLGLLPFMILAPAIFFNNLVMGVVLGPPLLSFLYPRVKRWGLRYKDVRGSRGPGNVSLISSISDSPQENDERVDKADSLALSCSDLSFQYLDASARALQHVSFSLSRGEMAILLGQSGSGKSTLCFACNGLVPRLVNGTYSGKLRIHGREVLADPVWRQANRVGLVFQDFDTQLVGTTVRGELLHPLEYHDPPLTAHVIQERMTAVLEQVGLAGMLERDPLTLSGGQRQRLAMASVLVQQPGVVVLDEPVSDLDPAGCAHFRSLLQQLCDQGKSVLLTEHEVEALPLGGRVLVMREGAIVWEGPPESLLRNPERMRGWGLQPFPLTECFEGMDSHPLPISVEEAWDRAEEMHLIIDPPGLVLDETLRLGDGGGKSNHDHPPLIEVRNVSFQYDTQSVLDGVSFSLFEKDFLAILGQNGSGKSTLARLLNGLLVPSKGRIMVEGLDTASSCIDEIARRVGLVFQNPDHQIFADTVWDEVAFGAKNLGYPKEVIHERVAAALDAVGLSVEKSHALDPFSLRKGERQRVAVAAVLATKPKVLIFDEPTTGLDVMETDRMMRMLKSLNQQGHTIVMITHSMRLVAEYAHQCVLMKNGNAVMAGTPREIFSNPSLIQDALLEIPAISRFSQRWGYTLLTVEEVSASFRHEGE